MLDKLRLNDYLMGLISMVNNEMEKITKKACRWKFKVIQLNIL